MSAVVKSITTYPARNLVAIEAIKRMAALLVSGPA
jgi:hypothetical protein